MSQNLQAMRRVKSRVEPGLDRLKEQLKKTYESGVPAGA
jgi:hypothetical protein